jgi:hypothetical protein
VTRAVGRASGEGPRRRSASDARRGRADPRGGGPG